MSLVLLFVGGLTKDTIMSLVLLFVGGLTKRHYYVSSLVVCRRAHKETLLCL
jgi:hypothetical protein